MMLKRRVYFILGVSFLLFSIIFSLNISAITGFAISEAVIHYSSYLTLWFFLAGIVLLFTAAALEEHVQGRVYDPGVKSFRRFLEKKRGREVNYTEAESLYAQALSKYEHQINRGTIKRPDKESPLVYIQSHINQYDSSKENRESPPRIMETEHFKKAIKKHDLRKINAAIAKIGTGKGREERLKESGEYSIRVSEEGRIIFNRDEDGNIILKNYTPDHRYDKVGAAIKKSS